MIGMSKRVLPLAALGLLAGCTVGPTWHRPHTATPSGYLKPVGDPAKSQAVAAPLDPSWWDIYRDPELSALERRVAGANLDLREASSRLLQSRDEERITGADRYPTADAQATYQRERASPNGILGLLGTTTQETPANTVANGGTGFGPSSLPGSSGAPPFDLWQYGFGVSWELDLWGRVRREVEASHAATERSADLRRDMLVMVLAETARDYVALRGVQAQIDVTKQNLAVAQHSLQLTHVRFSNGVTTQLDVANATAQVQSIEARLPPLVGQEAHLINALSYLAGEAPRALESELATTKPVPPVPDHVPVGLPSELAERRPDIRAAEARLHEVTAEIGVAVADFYPRVTLSGSLDIQALQATGLGLWNSRQYALGPSIDLPLFQGGRLRGTLSLRREQQKQAAIDYQRTVLKAWHEVDDALTDYNAAQNQRDRLEAAVAQNRQALSIAQLQYAQGSADFLNVLTVQNLLLAAQSQLIGAQTDTATALAGLYKALGGGWQMEMPAVQDASAPNAGGRAS